MNDRWKLYRCAECRRVWYGMWTNRPVSPRTRSDFSAINVPHGTRPHDEIRRRLILDPGQARDTWTWLEQVKSGYAQTGRDTLLATADRCAGYPRVWRDPAALAVARMADWSQLQLLSLERP